MKSPWKLLVEYQRSGLTEASKFGALCWVSGKQVLHLCGEDVLFYSRSTAKPLHMKAVAKDLDKILSWEQKALGLASHNAEPHHLEVLNQLLSKEDRRWIQVPPGMPLNGPPVETLQQAFHPCSGEHSALIRACMQKQWDLGTYTSREHPFHLAFMEYIRSVLGSSWNPEFLAPDGCGLQTASFSLSQLATLYANLAKEKNKDWIWEVMIRNPHLVGGTKRLDTTIMQSCRGNVIAKEGADGLLGMSVLHPKHPEGLGVVIKLAHGSDAQAMWYVAHKVLAKFGWEIPFVHKLFRQEAVVNPEIVHES